MGTSLVSGRFRMKTVFFDSMPKLFLINATLTFCDELMKLELFFSPEDKFYWKYVCLVDVEERLISVNYRVWN